MTKSELRSHWYTGAKCPVCGYKVYTDGERLYCSRVCPDDGREVKR